MKKMESKNNEQKGLNSSCVFTNSQVHDDDMPPIKLSFKDFIAACLAQYSIILPFAIGIWLLFFLLLLFISKIWFR